MTEMPPIASFRWPYNFLSNFFYWPVEYEGMEYRSSEHAYQAAKPADGPVVSYYHRNFK